MPCDHHAFDRALTEALGRWPLPVSPIQHRQLRQHFEAVIEANRSMNLTRITDPTEAAVTHYADSMALLLWAEDRRIPVESVLDVGTGAGFPAVPLAVMRPDWSVTAIDATAKKVDFLKRAAADMGLTNLRAHHAHSQHWQPGRDFQIVAFRAVAKLGKAIEQAARHVAPNGWLAAYKTADLDLEERNAAAAASARLGLRAKGLFSYELELAGEVLHRAIHLYQATVSG